MSRSLKNLKEGKEVIIERVERDPEVTELVVDVDDPEELKKIIEKNKSIRKLIFEIEKFTRPNFMIEPTYDSIREIVFGNVDRMPYIPHGVTDIDFTANMSGIIDMKNVNHESGDLLTISFFGKMTGAMVSDTSYHRPVWMHFRKSIENFDSILANIPNLVERVEFHDIKYISKDYFNGKKFHDDLEHIGTGKKSYYFKDGQLKRPNKFGFIMILLLVLLISIIINKGHFL